MNEESIAKKIIGMIRDAVTLKGQQQAAAHDLVIKTTTFTKTYTLPAGTSGWYTVTFTADKQKNPFAELNCELSGNSFDDFPEVKTNISASGSKVVTFRVNLRNYTGSSTISKTVTWHVLSTDTGVIAA